MSKKRVRSGEGRPASGEAHQSYGRSGSGLVAGVALDGVLDLILAAENAMPENAYRSHRMVIPDLRSDSIDDLVR